ncbi:MAG: NAD(P)H-dependent oxidoreductase subunit E [Bacillota bacterium]|nr:NAD(P)H-dependent oxidoreductase subunit E [Bacillota bacterium]
MSSKTATIPFTETAEQAQKLQDLIVRYKDVQGNLMPVMQQAQDIYGYLPIEVQKRIADGLDVPLSEVYGVSTFYSQFNLQPKGKYKIGVCLGTACYVKNSAEVFERIKIVLGIDNGCCTPDGMFSLDATRCLGCCGLAPVMMINDDVYGRLVPEEVDKIIDKYKKLEVK